MYSVNNSTFDTISEEDIRSNGQVANQKVINNIIKVIKDIDLGLSRNLTRIEDHFHPVFYSDDIYLNDEPTTF